MHPQPLSSEDLSRLAQQYGLGDAYYDYKGQYKIFSDAARSAILRAMGVEGASKPNASILPPVRVCTHDELYCDLATVIEASEIELKIKLESGTKLKVMMPLSRHGELTRVALPHDLPYGYHRLRVRVADHKYDCALIVTPGQSYEPDSMRREQKLWGLSLQLYTLRSDHNWGIGDFGDLQQTVRLAAPLGCATLGLNPLHALRAADASCISPYSPSHRSFLNVLYVAVPLVPEFEHCAAVKQWLETQQQALQNLRAARCVDYLGVARLKFTALRMLYAEFRHTQIEADTPRARLFAQYVDAQGEALYRHALYEALDQYFAAQPGHHWGWRSWPSEYHDPNSAVVKQFAAQHARQIEYYVYLQWLAATQLEDTQKLAKQYGMTLGLYGDVAVGVDPNGSEVWGNRALYVPDIAVGAPPDPLALKGQDWGIPPQHPVELAKQAYEPFVRMLRANMQTCGALRIDHVMTLCRLWWVPRGFESTEGVYVHYPLDDLMKLVALESERNQCLVIGEDLGTVPDAMRHAMHRFNLYHYKVLFFEKRHDGQFVQPHEYVANALAVVTTHDLPPFMSWWQGDDIVLREQLNLYPGSAVRDQVKQERDQDRRLLMQALTQAGLWGWQAHEPLPEYSFALMRAAYLYAGLSRARLLVIQPEDLQHMIDPVNVPGTSTEHPNWQRKLDADLTTTLADPAVLEMLQAMNKARCGENPNG